MQDSSNELIRCIAVAKTYRADNGPIPALSATDVCLSPGETLAMVGPSGCGKSTLLLMMAGLEPPTTGRVEFKGEHLVRPHREISLVLQDYGLFPWKTVRDNVELGLRIRREPVNRTRIDELLTELDISDKGEVYPQQLSGGQKQTRCSREGSDFGSGSVVAGRAFCSLGYVDSRAPAGFGRGILAQAKIRHDTGYP